MKVYGLFQTSAIEAGSGIRPVPNTLIGLYETERLAVVAMHQKRDWCVEAYKVKAWTKEWMVCFAVNSSICNLFIKELEVMK